MGRTYKYVEKRHHIQPEEEAYTDEARCLRGYETKYKKNMEEKENGI